MADKDRIKRSLVSDRISKIPRSAIHEMTRLSMQVKDPVSLSWARPAAGSPEHINEAACQAIKAGLVSGYSASIGLPELREAIVEKLKRDNNVKADPSEVLITVGAIEGLSAAVMALLDPGDEVLIPSPNYSTHAQQVVLASAVPVYVPTIEDEGFRLNIDAFRKAVTKKTKAIMFCTPSNPTGAVFEEKELKALGKVALENDLAIIVDESYEYFTFDGVKHFSLASIPELKEKTVSCFTFTKTYAMTGWRVGYVLAKAEWVTQMLKAHIPFTICAPVVSQYAALAALQGPQDCVAKFKKKYLDLRDLTCERLDNLSSVFEYQKPKGSYCMFPKILLKEGSDSLSFCKKLLLEGKVSTTPGVAFGPTGEGHLRITFCDSEEAINKAFDRMEKYFGRGLTVRCFKNRRKTNMAQIRISAKDLGILALPNFCPRCFWIRMHCANKLPFQIFPGIFSSIDSYTKKVTSAHFARYNQLPSWLGELGDLGKPMKVPHYSRFCVLDEKSDVLLTGTPDEILQRDDGSHFIIDYKTSKFTKTQDSLLPMYEVQLNAYAYIGKRQGFDPVSSIALVYMEPQTDLTQDELDSILREDGFLMGFAGHVLPLKLEAEQRIPPLLEEVRRIYDLELIPPGIQDCRDCKLLDQLMANVTGRALDR